MNADRNTLVIATHQGLDAVVVPDRERAPGLAHVVLAPRVGLAIIEPGLEQSVLESIDVAARLPNLAIGMQRTEWTMRGPIRLLTRVAAVYSLCLLSTFGARDKHASTTAPGTSQQHGREKREEGTNQGVHGTCLRVVQQNLSRRVSRLLASALSGPYRQ